MASILIHIAIAKKYCEKNPNENLKEFILGSTLPDSSKNKNLTHHGNVHRSMPYFEYAKNKVDLKRLVRYVPMNSSINRGIFMHLISDYVFFNSTKNKLNPEKLQFLTLEQSACDCRHDYDVLNHKLLNKYDLNVKDIPPCMNIKTDEILDEPLLVFNENEIYNFIEDMANLDIDKIYSEIENDSNCFDLNRLF